MRQKFAGGIFLLIGAGSGLYGLILLGPVVWSWMVAAATAVAETVSANANAFAAFQSENPAAVGLIALGVGAVFALIGYFMAKESGSATRRMPGVERSGDEPVGIHTA